VAVPGCRVPGSRLALSVMLCRLLLRQAAVTMMSHCGVTLNEPEIRLMNTRGGPNDISALWVTLSVSLLPANSTFSSLMSQAVFGDGILMCYW